MITKSVLLIVFCSVSMAHAIQYVWMMEGPIQYDELAYILREVANTPSEKAIQPTIKEVVIESRVVVADAPSDA